jgi:hypothetical protein
VEFEDLAAGAEGGGDRAEEVMVVGFRALGLDEVEVVFDF